MKIIATLGARPEIIRLNLIITAESLPRVTAQLQPRAI